MAFHVQQPDEKRSPFTGMSRRHWLDSGAFLLEGVLQHVSDPEMPIRLPKQPGKTYPKDDDPAWRFRSAEFEGLARTYMIAGSLVENEPDLEIAGIKVRDYYANQVLRSTDPGSDTYWGTVKELRAQYGSPIFQHTCETAALVLGLETSYQTIWSNYSKAEKDQVARFLSDTGHSTTNSHNWRFFNVMMLSFLDREGYPIEKRILHDHLHNLLAYYAGDGWYRDNATFDYYSVWAFSFYAPIWCRMYGYEYEPEIAAVFDQYHDTFVRTYPQMFARDGKSFMWGRSIIYRCAASSPLATAFMLKETPLDPGWARRIASGNLLQFLTRDDVFVDGTPGLGFYRPFDPMVQGYSCAASPFWLAKIYMALALDKESPFWTATENEGDWAKLENDSLTTVLPGPGLAISRHGRTGSAELRSGKHAGGKKPDPNYDRLVYNTEFLWESDNPQGATAGAYAITEYGTDLPMAANIGVSWAGEWGGVLYRQSMLRGWMGRVDLADIVVPGGCLRVDRVRMATPHDLRLGHFALPHVDGQTATVKEHSIHGKPAIEASVGRRVVALVALEGWDGVGSEMHRDLNPEADESTVIYAGRSRDSWFSGMFVCVTLMLHRTDGSAFDDGDLAIVNELEILPLAPSGSPFGVRVELAEGNEYLVDFGGIEGRLQR